MYAVARAAWMFRYFGAKNVRILNGGLKKWLQEGRPSVSGEIKKTEGGDFSYSPMDESLLIMDIAQMHKVAEKLYLRDDSAPQVIDTRPEHAFMSGRIQNSNNIPFSVFFNQENGTIKSDEQILKEF